MFDAQLCVCVFPRSLPHNCRIYVAIIGVGLYIPYSLLSLNLPLNLQMDHDADNRFLTGLTSWLSKGRPCGMQCIHICVDDFLSRRQYGRTAD